MYRKFALLASTYGLLAVALGAFGAHALKSMISANALLIWQTGVQYQMVHALALMLVYLISNTSQSRYLTLAAYGFSLGIILFSFSLYGLALYGIKLLGALTPIGGVLFIIAWLGLIIHFAKLKN